MKGSTLIELFKTLTIKDMKEFLDCFGTPHYGKLWYPKEAKKMLEILIKYAPDDLDSENLSKEKVYKKIFPKGPFTEGRLDKVMSELSKALRTFLSIQYYLREENTSSVRADFAQILLDRKLMNQAANNANLLLEHLNKKPEKNANIYNIIYRTAITLLSMESRKTIHREDVNVAQTLRYLDLYYFSARLNLLNQYLLLGSTKLSNSGIDMEREVALIRFFEVSVKESPSIYIAQKVFEFYQQKEYSTSAIHVLLNALQTYGYALEEEETKSYYVLLRSYCSHLIQSGQHPDLIPLLYQIQRDNLSKGYFYYLGEIPPGTFLNITFIALRSKELEWTYQFIQSHKSRIMGDNETHDYYRLALALYYFYAGYYEQSLDYIPGASQNLDYHLYARRLELMNYYETNSELLAYKLDAFKMYLSRGRQKILSQDYYERNNNFLNILIQLAQSKPGDPKRQETLLRRVEEKTQIVIKDWLVEKIKKLK